MSKRDHGGGVDAAVARWGGLRGDWLDLSTGINPVPYPVGEIAPSAWTALPDAGAMDRLLVAARAFWGVPGGTAILAAPGASALIARLPGLCPPARVRIDPPTYNEHAAAFAAAGWMEGSDGAARVIVHPNNPDGRLWTGTDERPGDRPLLVIDESFCDTCPGASLVAWAEIPGVVVLKSFGKFWGLAGLRLGFAIARPDTIARLAEMLGPWAVSGPALSVATRALADAEWAETTRARLAADAARLDALMTQAGAEVAGGTTLFRLYTVDGAARWQDRLARHRILVRVFPWSATHVRLGLPGGPADWARLQMALER